jgi:GNAT superfamily N-acetyltransferase
VVVNQIIRPLSFDEIPRLDGFAPPDWSTDLSVTFGFHFGQPYFCPIAAELEGELVGCANGILNGRAGWLGNIIVLPEYRGHGIGTALTQYLVDYFIAKGCVTQILIATSMGEPIYRKFGFRRVAEYIFLNSRDNPSVLPVEGTRLCRSDDYDKIFRIDFSITAEDRRSFLNRFLDSGYVHESSKDEVDGFFLPELSQGAILAENNEAGLGLLSQKLRRGCNKIVIPEQNQSAVTYLTRTGYQEVGRAPRMLLGVDLNWQPACIYSRGSGYSG